MDFDAVVYCVGAITLSYYLLKLLYAVYHNWIVFISPSYPDFSKFGKWSVVTGSTDGIGKYIAFELAARGQNIILIARNQEKLDAVSNEIKSKYGVETKCLKIDFSHDDEIYDEINEFLRGYDIGVLINNVGKGSFELPFLEIVEFEPSFSKDAIRINCKSVVKMTEIVLPEMLKRRRGLIVNISSARIIVPVGLSSIYGATKSFVHYFSQALAYEYQNSGVMIQSCTPGYVNTNMTQNTSSFGRPYFVQPQPYAKSLMGTIGKESWTYGFLKHTILLWIIPRIPLKLLRFQYEASCEEVRTKRKKKMG